MENKTFTVAVLGAGNIGSAVLSRLESLDNDVLNLELKKVLVQDTSKDRGVSKDLLTDNFEDILNDESIDLVIELIVVRNLSLLLRITILVYTLKLLLPQGFLS